MNSIRQWVAALFLALLAFGEVSETNAAAASFTSTTAEEQRAPAFSIRTLDGKEVNSSQLAGRLYVVNFFASWCPPCRQELPGMVALQKKYEKQGFTFIGIAFRDRKETLPDFLWEMGVEYPVAMTSPELEAAFGKFLPGGQIRAIPTTFVVGRDGRILNAVTGGLTQEDFESIILKAIGTKPSR